MVSICTGPSKNKCVNKALLYMETAIRSKYKILRSEDLKKVKKDKCINNMVKNINSNFYKICTIQYFN